MINCTHCNGPINPHSDHFGYRELCLSCGRDAAVKLRQATVRDDWERRKENTMHNTKWHRSVKQ